MNRSTAAAAAASSATAENASARAAVAAATTQRLSENPPRAIVVCKNIPTVVNRDRPAVAAKSSIASDRTDAVGVASIATLTCLAKEQICRAPSRPRS